MKKSGKYIATILGCAILGYIVGNNALTIRKIKKTQEAITWIQYLNRLQEFCIDNIDQARQQFIYLIEKGTELQKAFDIVVSMNYDDSHSLEIE